MRQVQDILDPIVSAMAADGAVLSVESVMGSTLRVRLDATSACAECVVADAVLEAIVLGQLRMAGSRCPATIERVEIEHAAG